jgi:hypothetical protein
MGEHIGAGLNPFRMRRNAPQSLHWACGCRAELSSGLPALLAPCARHDDVSDDVARLDACANASSLAPARLSVISGTFWTGAKLRV